MAVTIVILVSICVLCVGIHFEVLVRASSFMSRHHTRPKRRILLGVFATGAAHVTEVLAFGLGVFLLQQLNSQAQLAGDVQHQFLDSLYFSFACYSTLGFGDLVPMGPMKLFAGCEALAGLILIAWSASFLYLQMERYWRTD